MIKAHECNPPSLKKRQYYLYEVEFPERRGGHVIEITASPESGLLEYWYPQSMGYKHKIIKDLGTN